MIIEADSNHLAWAGKLLKLPNGPISELRPGPTTAIEVAAAEKAVNKSNPIQYNIPATIITEAINKKISANIERVVLSSIIALE